MLDAVHYLLGGVERHSPWLRAGPGRWWRIILAVPLMVYVVGLRVRDPPNSLCRSNADDQ